MDIKEILTLIQSVSDSNLTSFTYEEGDTKLCFEVNQAIRKEEINTKDRRVEVFPVVESQECFEYITSPMVGTFYQAASEEGKPFVEVGDRIKKGQVVGIIEAMKLMNEIESPFDGTVEEILVKNNDMVGFEQVLIKIKV